MDLTVAFVVFIAAIPGIVGLWRSIKRSVPPAPSPASANSATNTAVRSLENQVRRLNEEQRRASIHRDVWELDRRDLVHKVELLSERLATLQSYVRTVTALLTRHGIDHPSPPPTD